MNRVLAICFTVITCVAFSYSQTLSSIEGTVTTSDGSVIPGAVVTLINRDTNERRTTVADENGKYTFRSLPPGRYHVEVATTGYSKTVREISVSVGQAMTVDLQISPGISPRSPVTLQAVVTDRDGKAIAGVMIRITDRTSGKQMEVRTDPKGEYRSETLSPGKFEIEVEASGYRTEKKKISLRSGTSKTVRVRLRKID